MLANSFLSDWLIYSLWCLRSGDCGGGSEALFGVTVGVSLAPTMSQEEAGPEGQAQCSCYNNRPNCTFLLWQWNWWQSSDNAQTSSLEGGLGVETEQGRSVFGGWAVGGVSGTYRGDCSQTRPITTTHGLSPSHTCTRPRENKHR